jgi:hypothetical protein
VADAPRDEGDIARTSAGSGIQPGKAAGFARGEGGCAPCFCVVPVLPFAGFLPDAWPVPAFADGVSRPWPPLPVVFVIGQLYAPAVVNFSRSR